MFRTIPTSRVKELDGVREMFPITVILLSHVVFLIFVVPGFGYSIIDKDFEDANTSLKPWTDESRNGLDGIQWKVESSNYPAQTPSDINRPVNNYARLSNNSSTGFGPGVLASPPFTAYPGDVVNFSFWIRSLRDKSNNLELHLRSMRGKEVLLKSFFNYSNVHNVKWKPASVPIPVSQPTELKLVFYGYCGFTSEYDAIALDDIRLISVETPTFDPTTKAGTTAINFTSSTITTRESSFSSSTTTSRTTSNTEANEFVCPSLSQGVYPIEPGTCNNSFYFCLFQIAFKQSCPDTQVFDPFAEKCGTLSDCYAGMSDAVSTSQEDKTTAISSGSTTSDTISSSSFEPTTVPTTDNSSDPTTSDPSSTSIDPTSVPTTEGITSTTEFTPITQCPDECDHPSCRYPLSQCGEVYYNCNRDGIPDFPTPYEVQCRQPGQVFNPITRDCDDPANVLGCSQQDVSNVII